MAIGQVTEACAPRAPACAREPANSGARRHARAGALAPAQPPRPSPEPHQRAPWLGPQSRRTPRRRRQASQAFIQARRARNHPAADARPRPPQKRCLRRRGGHSGHSAREQQAHAAGQVLPRQERRQGAADTTTPRRGSGWGTGAQGAEHELALLRITALSFLRRVQRRGRRLGSHGAAAVCCGCAGRRFSSLGSSGQTWPPPSITARSRRVSFLFHF